MLEELKSTNHIRKASSAIPFWQQYQMVYKSIVEVVVEKAHTMETELTRDIIKDLERTM